MTLFSIAGYIGSGLIAISLMVGDPARFRLFNSIGNIFFIVYGISADLLPVTITNSILLSINIYKTFRQDKISRVSRSEA